jgi:hypothetical protein
MRTGKLKINRSFSFGRIRAKLAGMNKPLKKRDLDMEYQEKRLWMTMYGCLLSCGLDLFEPNGLTRDCDGVGAECLLDLRTHFERREAYGRAGFVNEMIVEYQKRWPERYKDNGLIFESNPTNLN